ncbi:phosphoethanolamine transferase [Rouxiella sp. Mn2063]|uniref:phosphoethanolamine transferase n=1 Tax=Rouxiella sp. Mn2063 TaxID=3395262 RepID=UPI003BCC221A
MERLNGRFILALATAILFSIIVDTSFGYSLRIGYAIAVFSLLLSTAKHSLLFGLLLIFITITSVLYSPIAYMYGTPSINIIVSAQNTNINESYEFLKNLPLIYLTPALLLIITSYITLKNRKSLIIKNNTISLAIFILIVIFTPLKSYLKSGVLHIHDVKFTLFRFCNDFYNSYESIALFNEKMVFLKSLPSEWSPSKPKNDYDTYIIVIGESARKDFMHSYGFQIDNTPFTDSMNGLIFKNYISAAGSTQASLSTTFSLNKGDEIEQQNNIIRLAKKQGFYTYWISNQGSIGGDDSIVSYIGQQADSFTFLKKGEYNTQSFPDTDLLVPYQAAILNNNSKKKKLIFIHIMGSHPNFCDRTDNKYDYFYENDKLSCYIQSIKNTDYLLSEITKIADRNKKKWTMLYFSDHGLSFMSAKGTRNLQHNDKYKQNFQVPFIVTSYDAKSRVTIDQLRSAFDFLGLYLQWTGSTDPLLPVECNYLSKMNCKKQIKIKDFNNNVKNYMSLIDE